MILEEFVRVSKLEPCPVCDRPDWCLRANDGSDRVLCCRVESSVRWSCGWIHGRSTRRREPRILRIVDPPSHDQWERISAQCRLRLQERSEIRGQLSIRLGVTVDSLDALDVGIRSDGVFTFPMRDHKRRVVGIRLRDWSGEKWAITGSRNGLFIPDVDEESRVIVTESESDCAAALTLGSFAIGRPGCMGGTEQFLRWLKLRVARDVVVFADRDDSGVNGAAAFAVAIAPHVRSLRVIVGPRNWKDLRVALQGGYSRADLLQDIDSAERIRSVLRVAGTDHDGLTLAHRLAARLRGEWRP